MQQTDKYKLNLIDRNDTFSPDPLNENMAKLEEAITDEAAAEAAARAADVAALDQRLQVIEARRMVIGSAKEGEKVYLGFTPKALFTKGANGMEFFFGSVSSRYNLSLVDGELKHSGSYADFSYIAFL